VSDPFNFGMGTKPGAHLPFEMAFPSRYIVSPEIIGTDAARKAKEACKYDAVDLDMQPKTLDLDVGAIVWATGWEPYDATKIDNLGFGQYDNIITNMMMERLAPPVVPPKARSCVRPTTRLRKASPLFSVPVHAMKTICPTVPTSAAWPP
jgi:quinone-modifying oxidoreductase subunit QmoA